MYLSLIAHALLRMTAGAILVSLGYRHWKQKESVRSALSPVFPSWAHAIAIKLAVAEAMIGLALIAGFYTQIAALAAIIFSIKILMFRKRLTHPLFPSPLFYVLLIAVSLSLFITGAGAFAFDLPI